MLNKELIDITDALCLPKFLTEWRGLWSAEQIFEDNRRLAPLRRLWKEKFKWRWVDMPIVERHNRSAADFELFGMKLHETSALPAHTFCFAPPIDAARFFAPQYYSITVVDGYK